MNNLPRVGHRQVSIVVICVLQIVLVQAFLAQSLNDLEQRANESVRGFGDSNWLARQEAFVTLLDLTVPGGIAGRTPLIPSSLASLFASLPSHKEQITSGLIGLLARENDLQKAARAGQTDVPGSDAYQKYFGDLLAAVGALRAPRAVDVLLENIASGTIATDGLAALGPDALPHVVRVLQGHKNYVFRSSAARTLTRMLDDVNIKTDSDSRSTIKAELLRASNDDSPFVRVSAVNGLAKLPDADVSGVLRRIAERDSYQRRGVDARQATFPVREAALKALALRARDDR